MASRKPTDGHIKRPRNAFLCFRCDKSAVREAVRRFPEAHTEVEALGMLWKTYSEEEKKPWFGMALEEAKQHAKAYPGESPKKYKTQRKRQMAPRKFRGTRNDVSSALFINSFSSILFANISLNSCQTLVIPS